MTIEELVEWFPGAKKTSRGWEAHCPAHDDKRASLGIGTGENGGIVICCGAGCATADVLKAVGLTWKAIFPDGKQPNAEPTIYRYEDENGEPLFEVVRTPDKRFYQRKFGSKEWGLNGARRVLYRLPQLLSADPAQPIFIVEGEKDAEALSSRGLVATTSPMGAGKWRADYTDWIKKHLPDRRFIIIPDEDGAGAAHGVVVYQALASAGLQGKIVHLDGLEYKEHGGADVSDWLKQGGTVERLLALIAAAPEEPKKASKVAGYTAAELMAMEIPPPRWAVPGVLCEGLNILAGAPKLGKSFLGLDLGVAVASGGYALGKIEVEAGPVLYLALEDHWRRLQERLKMRLQGSAAPPDLHLRTNWPRVDEGGLTELRDWLNEHPTCRLVIIDTLKKVRSRVRQPSASIYDLDYEYGEALKQVADDCGVTFLVLTHTRKAPADDVFDTLNASLGLTGAADATLVLCRSRGSDKGRLHMTGRDIDEQAEDDALALQWDKHVGSWTIIGTAADLDRSEERQEIIDLLTQSPVPLTPSEIAASLEKNINTTKVLLMKMYQDGELIKEERGKYWVACELRKPRKPVNYDNGNQNDDEDYWR